MLTYFYSGTGNSRRVATWLHALAGQRAAGATLLSVEQARPAEDLALLPDDGWLALCYPTHGFTAPWHLLKFVARLPRGRGRPTLVVATRAGIRVGAWHPPGMAGSALVVVALLLLLRGFRPRAGLSVNMPSNWWSAHPPQSSASHQAIVERSERIVRAFVGRVLDGGRGWLTLNNLYELCCGLALAWLSAGYLLIGRIFLAKLFFSNSRCTACGLCARSCPVQAIRMWGQPRPRPYWSYHCESCMRCAAFCPTRAIEAGHSIGLLIYLATSLPLLHLAVLSTSRWLGWNSAALPGWLDNALWLLWWYPSMIATYGLLWWLMRFAPVRWLLTRTTLTHYWGRYLLAGTRLSQLRGRRPARASTTVTTEPSPAPDDGEEEPA